MPLVAPELDQRTFEQILTEVRRRIPTFTPEWTDLNESDPGIVLAQLFAFMSEQLLFQVNQVPTKGLVTFLKLVGQELHAATPAEADVEFALASGGSTNGYVDLPAGTQVQTSAPPPGSKTPITFETERDLQVLDGKLEEIASIDCTGAFVAHTAVNDAATGSFAPFGKAKTTEDALLLGFSLNSRSEWPSPFTLRVRVNLAGSREVGEPGSSDGPSIPTRIEWGISVADTTKGAMIPFQPIAPSLDSTEELTRSGYVAFTFDAETASAFQKAGENVAIDFLQRKYVLRARIARADAYDIPPSLASIRINAVPALAVVTVKKEPLGGSTGLPFQRFRLANAPVLEGSSRVMVRELDGTTTEWKETDDLFAAMPHDRVYQLNCATGEITFGNGTFGRIPTPDDGSVAGGNISAAEYRFGGGRAGNVGVRTLTRVLAGGAVTFDASNVLPAAGGADEESITAGIARAPAVIRSRYRAVSAEDFEALAREAPGVRVARARAVAEMRPGRVPGTSPGCVTVVLVPYAEFADSITSPLPVPEYVARHVLAYLDGRRLVTSSAFTASATFRKVTVEAKLTAAPRALLTQVRADALLAVQRYFHALVGGDDGEGWPFGESIYFSRVFQRLLDVPGVARVDRLLLSLDDGAPVECGDLSICAGELLYSGAHEISVGAT